MYDTFDTQCDISYNENRMKAMSIHSRRILRAIVPALMLVLLLASMTISTLHSHRGCENPYACPICAFQISSCTLPRDTPSESGLSRDPVSFFISILSKRVSHPFHTLVFASHAPPQFC
jgi:hypothetical protein